MDSISKEDQISLRKSAKMVISITRPDNSGARVTANAVLMLLDALEAAEAERDAAKRALKAKTKKLKITEVACRWLAYQYALRDCPENKESIKECLQIDGEVTYAHCARHWERIAKKKKKTKEEVV
jgi:hypothetical protein